MATSSKKAAEETISATELAALVNRDPKLVRAYLRKEFARDIEVKGSRWVIPTSVRDAVSAHFAKLDEAKAAS